ncbi:TonB-dependent siderophore receptor, partial [Steroidobacter sp.]|uniref:TonB-dependent siderophore receptor n=1 Tax=Steroidobacter sp. TaxID=1978227 RepID=UPI001A3911EA
MFIKRARVGSLLALAIAASLVASGASAAGQQTPAPETRITIPAGDLITALDALAKQTRVELIYDRDQLEGLKTRGIDASLTPSAAVNKLIEGTPLTLRIDSSGAMVVAAPQPSASRNGSINLDDTLSEVIVTGRLLDNVSMMKRGETMRETPQSVTIMTQQRIEEQSLLSISEVIDQAPGMTVENDYYGKPATYYSRGFEISNMQIDGVSVDVNRSYFFSPNLAMYEQVEVLRGADGLFAGSGEPGGTINLVRKRGRADAETIVTAQGGSWNNFNAMLDVTGPLGFDGRLRGRAVATWRDRDYFYDTAHDKGRFFYGTLEADVTSSTLLVVGGSHDE